MRLCVAVFQLAMSGCSLREEGTTEMARATHPARSSESVALFASRAAALVASAVRFSTASFSSAACSLERACATSSSAAAARPSAFAHACCSM